MQWGSPTTVQFVFPIAFSTLLIGGTAAWNNFNPGNAYSQWLGYISSTLMSVNVLRTDGSVFMIFLGI